MSKRSRKRHARAKSKFEGKKTGGGEVSRLLSNEYNTLTTDFMTCSVLVQVGQ